MAEWYSIMTMYHIFFMSSSINEHLGYCFVLADVNGAAYIFSSYSFVWVYA